MTGLRSVPSRLTDAICSSSAGPILVSSSLVQVVIGRLRSRGGAADGASRLDHDLDRFPLVHRPVAVGHAVEAHDLVKYPAGFDPAFEDVRQKLLDVRADLQGYADHR